MTKRKIVLLCIFISIFFAIIIGFLFFYSNTDKEPKKKVIDEKPNYRAVYHFTTPDKWKNDPQKPIFFDGKYHYYYLYNGEYPKGNGTEWRHATSEDLVHWSDEGVAIPKFTNNNGDVWSGSVVVDSENTAGFGKDAVVAILTQPSGKDGAQQQHLWYSTDKGKTFKSYSDNPVMPNPGVKDFRDPKIIWNSKSNKWTILLAEGNKIGFYESDNLKDWQYTGGFFTKDIGIVECPDLFMMKAEDGAYKWVMGASANGKSVGKPNTYAYWTGDFNGKEFIPDESEPQWLDYGFDWYAGVTFESGNISESFIKRYALAWMNNWDYANNTPTTKENFNGIDSIVREISLKKQDDRYSLFSQPVETLNDIVKSTEHLNRVEVTGTKTLEFTGESYELDADISWEDAENVGLRLRESEDKSRHIDVGIFVDGKYSYVNRGFTSHPDAANKYIESRAPFDTSKKKVHLKIIVDKTSIEVFVDDGKVTYSNEAFPDLKDKGISLYSIGGKAVFENIQIKHFDSINEKD